MNYYPHHIGDYDSHTSHLNWLEDAAYSRMIRLYYRTEKPLSSKVEQICRLLRANSAAEKKAVNQVLEEFFILQDDGWHNSRCDAEIHRANSKAERNREVGKLGGRPRKTETKTDNPGNPKETQTVIYGNPNETLPIANSQEPNKATAAIIPPVVAPTDEKPSPPPVVGKPEKPEPPPKPEVARNVQIAVLLREWERDRGKFAKITSATPQLQGWIDRGASNDQIREAYDLAVAMRSSNGDEGAINAGIVDTFLAQILNPPAATSALNRHPPPGTVVPWQASWSGIVAKGQELGMHQSEAEHPQAFKARVFEAAQMTPEEKAVLRADYGVHA